MPSATATTTSAPKGDEPKWAWNGSEPGFGESFYHGPIVVKTSVGDCRFVYDDVAQTRTVDCVASGGKNPGARVWGWDEAGAFVEDAAVATESDVLFVALFSNIGSGCELRAYRITTGEELWRTHLVGLGPIDHSEYLNDVQLQLRPERVLVFGWESEGRYIEVVDRGSGRTIDTLRISTKGATSKPSSPPPAAPTEPPHPGAAASIPWKWEGPDLKLKDTSDATVPVVGKGTCSFHADHEADTAELACRDSNKKRTWGFVLAGQGLNGAALVADDKTLYYADYNRIASGTTVWAFDLRTGQVQWKTHLFGVGPVAHSKYRNDVSMRLDKDRLVVFGRESAGKYVEVLERATGKSIGNRKE